MKTYKKQNSLNYQKENSMDGKRLIKTAIVILLLSLSFISCGTDTDVTKITDESNSSVLTDSQKFALSYMWHEEKLAYDVYKVLGDMHDVRQMSNITKSEIKHMESVRSVIETYNLDITNLSDEEAGYSEEVLLSMPLGEYSVEKIQNLYDILYDKGKNSPQDALEVACMVEVTDIDDLANFLEDEELPQDIKDSFTNLIEGSYKHYWAFDNGLKNLGIEDGCCSLDVIDGVDYCHSEYPK